MGIDAIDIIVNDLNIEQWDENRLTGISIFRPSENTPSMTWDKKNNCFHCFATDNNYGIIDHFMKYNNLSYIDAIKKLMNIVGYTFSDKDFVGKKSKQIPNDYKPPIDEPDNDRQIVNNYLSLRCISSNTLDFCSVKQSKSGDIAFQLKDSDGIHKCTKYRVSRPATNKDVKWFWQKNTTALPLLYNIDKIDKSKPLLIVEGFIDCLSCVEAGYYNTVSIPGGANSTDWIDFHYDDLEEIKEIILWFDDDEVGSKSVKEVAHRLGLHKVKVVKSDKDIKDIIADYYSQFTEKRIDKMDANNVLISGGIDLVLSCIRSASEIENPMVKKLMGIDEKFIKDLPRISYGFKDLDRHLLGNFTNSLTIISGKQSSGKSTIVNTMFINEPLENNEKVFIYSGEMPPDILLGTVLRPLASRRHIMRIDNTSLDLPDTYFLTDEARKFIKKYYMDGLYIYDTISQLDTSPKTLINTMEYCYKRYGIINFIIDNLMTVDCSGMSEDKYEGQKGFVLMLTKFTNTYPVRVALVAHSKKLPHGVKEMSDDDVQGASEIMKLADRAFSVTRLIEDKDNYDSLVTIMKDRQTGKNGRKTKMFYDEGTNRLYSNSLELDKKYSWEDIADIRYDVETSAYLSINTTIPKTPNTINNSNSNDNILNHIS